MMQKIFLLSSLVLALSGCAGAMKNDFDCNVPNKGVCDSLGNVNKLVDSGYFNEADEAPKPDANSSVSIWLAEDKNEFV